MTISNLKVTPAGAAAWTNRKPYSAELVVMWRKHGDTIWQSEGIDHAETSFQIPVMSAGVTYDVAVVPDPGRLNATFTAPTPPPTPPPPVKVQAGVAAGGNLQNEDPVTISRDLDAIAAMGAGWLRVDVNWAQIQAGGPLAFNWTSDALIRGAIARGIGVHAGIVYAPGWAAASASSPPNVAMFGTFVKQAVAHYAAMGVHSFEIWNEPNLGSNWGGNADPTAYTAMLKAAYPAAKLADPTCMVVTAGLSPAPTDGTNLTPADFLAGVYAAGGAGFFDAVGHHPYCSPALPGSTDAWSAWFQMGALRALMTAHGDSAKQIWATEFGAPTGGPKSNAGVVSEVTQAAMITAAFRVWGSYSWAGPLFVYQHRDLGTDPGTDQDWYGLLRNDFSAKPAAAAFKTAVTA